jgi:uncharacterized membrane protein
MLHLSNALLVILLWFHLAGFALALRRFIASWTLTRVASPILLVSALFFTEHFVGLGQLNWMLPFTTAFSLWMVIRSGEFLRSRWRTETIFLAGFLYALLWRYAFPDIDASSEKITDLTFIADYMGGGRLPPVDRWLPPFAFDMYYALQHYAAALIGRTLGAPVGTAYNLGFCTIVALTTTAAGATAMLLVRRRLPAILLTAVFLVGGVGTAPLIRQINPNPPLHASVRFIGSYLAPENATLDFGRWLLQASHVNAATPDLPVETFSYLIGLGDFHPPLSGFLLLMMALLCIAHIENGLYPKAAHALLAASVPLTIACNSWLLPLQAGLVGGYLLIRRVSGKPVDWIRVAAGFTASLLLLEPFLSHFGAASVDAGMAIRIVPSALHTPPLLWIATFYPVVLLIALHLVCGDKSRRTVGLCLLWVLLLAASEIFYVDDLYAGKFERFNTALKWWAWIYSGGMLLIGGLNLRARSRICRRGTAAVLILLMSFTVELGHQYFTSAKPHLGQMDGAGGIRDDAGERVMIDLLLHEPPAVVLQRLPKDAYTIQPALTILAGQTAYLGWPSHENVWRGNRADIGVRKQQVETFYRGELPDSSRWLESNRIRYVLWLRDESQLPPHTFDKLNFLLRDRYQWRGYYEVGDYHVGLWEMRP